MKFTIDRSKWRCGGLRASSLAKRGEGQVALLNHEGFMCCLGQVGRQCNIPAEKMLNHQTPWALGPLQWSAIPLLVIHEEKRSDHTKLAREAMALNDDESLSDAERETKLTALFAEHGHEIEFVGEYVIPESVT